MMMMMIQQHLNKMMAGVNEKPAQDSDKPITSLSELNTTIYQGLGITKPTPDPTDFVAVDEGQKFDKDKPDMSLLSPIALVLLTKVIAFGAKKYARHDWRKGISEDKLIAACFRHLTAVLAGEICDRETGLPHAAHLMCEAMFLCEQYTSQAGAPVSYQYTEAQLDLLADLLAGKPYEI